MVMLYALLSVLIVAIIGAAAYYAAFKYIELRHNRNVIVDELQRATEHIAELEDRIRNLEVEKSIRDYKPEPQRDDTGWSSLDIR